MTESNETTAALKRRIAELEAMEEKLQQVQAELKERDDRYRMMFEYTGTAMLVVEEDTSVSMWNHKLEEVTGYTQEDAVAGQKWTDFVAEKDLARLYDYHTRRRQDPGSVPNEYEFSIKHKSGQLRSILMNVTLIPGTKKTLISMIDITERKKAEEARLFKAEEKARRANRNFERLHRAVMRQSTFHNMVSRSRNMKEIFDILPEMAEAQATVLVTGESGTGKELIARSLHDLGPRKTKPFIAINCSALPDNLLESELFGYKAGAFTDAKKDKPGKFAQAGGGTVFLDEIGDISAAMQVKLLRVLQEKIYEPLGSTKSEKADVRVIAATNRHLPDLIAEGTYREDLYYRLNVLSLHLPALRERRTDIPLLCAHFIQTYNDRYKKSIKEVSPAVLEVLLAHDFKGNIRELENIIERAFVFCKADMIDIEHLPADIRPGTAAEDAGTPVAGDNMAELEKNFISKVLSETGGNRGKAAAKLGMHRTTLFRKMKQYGLS